MALSSRTAIQRANVVGLAEIIDLTGEKKGTVSMWQSRSATNGFPDPVLDLAAGRFYLADEVIDWYWKYQPVSGRRKPPARQYVVSDSKDVGVGQQCPVLGSFDTEQAAAEFIDTLPEPETGRYNLDGPPQD